MGKILKINNPGLAGIDIVSSPFQVKEESLTNCQNGQLYPVDAEFALKKRDGMAKINSSAAAGSLLAIFNVPI